MKLIQSVCLTNHQFPPLKSNISMFQISLTLWFQALTLLVFQVGSQDLSKEFLDAHNAARKEVGVPFMKWDNVLEAYALNYAQGKINNCSLVHSVGPSGENLAWSNADLSGTDAVQLWVNEKTDYNLESGVCATGKVCGHYTQVIWINSTQLGCGKIRCNDNGTFIACNYYPRGNIPGKRPTEGIEFLGEPAVAPSPQPPSPDTFPPKKGKSG